MPRSKGFRHNMRLLQQCNKSGKEVVDAFEYLAPVIDTDQAMKFLLDLLQSKGAVILSETVDEDLWVNEGKVLEAHQADAIVNASGLGARELASDSTVHPARGGLLRLVDDGKDFEKVTFATVVNKAEKTDFKKRKKKQKKKKTRKIVILCLSFLGMTTFSSAEPSLSWTNGPQT